VTTRAALQQTRDTLGSGLLFTLPAGPACPAKALATAKASERRTVTPAPDSGRCRLQSRSSNSVAVRRHTSFLPGRANSFALPRRSICAQAGSRANARRPRHPKDSLPKEVQQEQTEETEKNFHSRLLCSLCCLLFESEIPVDPNLPPLGSATPDDDRAPMRDAPATSRIPSQSRASPTPPNRAYPARTRKLTLNISFHSSGREPMTTRKRSSTGANRGNREEFPFTPSLFPLFPPVQIRNSS
jgi:hypothetical protein